jgi:uncharacterized membrane protein
MREFSGLSFDGRSTAIGSALQTLAGRYEGRPLAGILMFTDGNATDLPEGVGGLEGLPPVYPVVIGTDASIQDVALRRVAVSRTAFEDAPITVQTDVSAHGFEGREVTARLLGTEGEVVTQETARVPGGGAGLSFRLRVGGMGRGLAFHALEVFPAADEETFPDPVGTSEVTLVNNARVVVVDRGAGPYRVLYVAGRPNWEYKFLNRALAEDPQLELAGLIRIANREPKFEFKGRPGESSNPLYRGFDKKNEETEEYDQAVVVRLNTRNEFELRGGFPRTAEDLFVFHAVVLDDVEAAFFTHDQMTLLRRFVSERGGGLMMLGGRESLHRGGYERTPIGDVLPVYLDHMAPAAPVMNLQLDLTREGWLQPWLRLRANEPDERARLEKMPPFQVMNRVRDVRPGAMVLATVTDGSGKQHPAIVSQRFGNGRSAVLTLGDMWRWGMRDAERGEDLAKGWRQMMRWLVSDVPQSLTLQARPKAGDPNTAVLLELRARDKEFRPLDDAAVTLTVSRVPVVTRTGPVTGPAAMDPLLAESAEAAADGEQSIRLVAEPSLSEPGLYQATFIPRETGGFRAEAVARGPNGAELGRAEAGWTSDPAAEEFSSLQPNRTLLEAIASRTGGEVIKLNDLASFAGDLPYRDAPVTEAWTFPLWHTPLMFLFALGCFVAEWGLRRWKGLA